MKAKSIMIQGTGSYVGKSAVAAALCRIFRQDGLRVAPFKPQNISLNSYITGEGGEIGRSQAVQAEAAGVEPSADMNPILIKPTSNANAQVIVQGKVYGNKPAYQDYEYKKIAIKAIKESYRRLTELYDLIIIEGAGSPAEINLPGIDLANMGSAELIGSPVLLVGDIDKGGVFASLVGTMELLQEQERELIRGFIINKFRGDKSLLDPGLKFLEERYGCPVLGVVPYFKDIYLPEEDSLSLERLGSSKDNKDLRLGIIHLPHISNFTDFDALEKEEGVRVEYLSACGPAYRPLSACNAQAGSGAGRHAQAGLSNGGNLKEVDLIIIPGSKNTIEDLVYLEETGIKDKILDYYRQGGRVVGICGGYQMLGNIISDPYQGESKRKTAEGLGLLNIDTTLKKEKATFLVEALPAERIEWAGDNGTLKGYEIHLGRTTLNEGVRPMFCICKRLNQKVNLPEGAVSSDGRVWGTYIHGIFDNDGFRRSFINLLRKEKGLPPRETLRFSYDEEKERSFNLLASLVRENLDMDKVYSIIEESPLP
jgi:adenosylcobyric acid synthase